MPLPYNPELKTILERRVHERLLDGYYGGIFNSTEDKFYALTWVNLASVDYSDYIWYHEQLSGYSAMHHDYEKTKKITDTNSWQGKTVQECIDDGIYQHFSMLFTGAFFEDEWFIVPSLRFYGDKLIEAELKQRAEARITKADVWENSMFNPEKPLEIEGSPKLDLSPEALEFKDQPLMVSIIKQRKKERINLAYTKYINEEFLEPFFERLRISDPDDYVEANQLRYGYTMIFPEHKQYTLFCAHVKNNKSKWQLRYFLFHKETRKFYKWTYFNTPEDDSNFFYGDMIIDDLKQISPWDKEGYLDSSCTLDDTHFWDNYVFKKIGETDEYLYLKQI
jgi:hypothetical protein